MFPSQQARCCGGSTLWSLPSHLLADSSPDLDSCPNLEPDLIQTRTLTLTVTPTLTLTLLRVNLGPGALDKQTPAWRYTVFHACSGQWLPVRLGEPGDGERQLCQRDDQLRSGVFPIKPHLGAAGQVRPRSNVVLPARHSAVEVEHAVLAHRKRMRRPSLRHCIICTPCIAVSQGQSVRWAAL